MKPIILTLAVLAAGPSHAAVSGFYDSAEQISTILGSGAVADKLRQMPVKELSFDGERHNGLLKWEIDTDRCDVDVFLKPVPPAGVGKTTYEVAEIRDCD